MTIKTTSERQTKYCKAVEKALLSLGHATNAEILLLLKTSYPNISATTIHRTTTRLALRGKIAEAPLAKDGSKQYETKTEPHDHFQCSICGNLQDADIKNKVMPLLKNYIDGCEITGRLTINGVCKKCIHKNKERI